MLDYMLDTVLIGTPCYHVYILHMKSEQLSLWPSISIQVFLLNNGVRLRKPNHQQQQIICFCLLLSIKKEKENSHTDCFCFFVTKKEKRKKSAHVLCDMGGSSGVINSLDFCPALLKSFGCFYFWCILFSQWKAVTVNLQILHCQL